MDKPFNQLESPAGKPVMSINLHDGSTEQVSIIVVSHNRPGCLNICLQSIYEMSNLNNYELIVVDNASDQDTLNYLDVLEQEGIKVVRNEENLHWSKAANQGVSVADPNSRYFIFMHCDVVVLDSAWIDILVNLAESGRCGVVGTHLGSYYLQKQQVSFLDESCILITRDAWNKIGPWPEELPIIGSSFIMTSRANYKGLNPQAVKNSIVHHYKSYSFNPSEFEQLSDVAYKNLPKLFAEAQRGEFGL